MLFGFKIKAREKPGKSAIHTLKTPYPPISSNRQEARPREKKKGRGPPRVPVPPSPPRKDKFDDDEKIKIEIDESLFTT
ncbi:hypothetical protein ES319_A01G240600v1 [Gossypium barbadense]|uniref:Uncharacterized protein n=2 Tax=Gossypium TaxID=3633 RepID=A0A2P5W665_GOSBA|nr:hypothetical protein ES319_A01G240600v1 [Gossypium barbadense]PPR86558.1 hypothetical protein GOBAR_AA34137 [Gossypium barbadense]TYH32519.1 hypothetical protein ES288_A01G258900v1 [Gossypium darwinii]